MKEILKTAVAISLAIGQIPCYGYLARHDLERHLIEGSTILQTIRFVLCFYVIVFVVAGYWIWFLDNIIPDKNRIGG